MDIAETLAALIGECTCNEAYKGRGLCDPKCVRCDCEDGVREYIEKTDAEIANLWEDNARLQEKVEKVEAVLEYTTDAFDAMSLVLAQLPAVQRRINDAEQQMAMYNLEGDA